MSDRSDTLADILRLIRPLSLELDRATDEMLSQTRLTPRMRAMLETLYLDGDQTVPQLAARLGIKRQYTQVMMHEIVTAGFANRRPNPAHRRSSLYQLSLPGRAACEGLARAEDAITDSLAEGQSHQSLRATRDVLRGLLNGYTEMNTRLRDGAGTS